MHSALLIVNIIILAYFVIASLPLTSKIYSKFSILRRKGEYSDMSATGLTITAGIYSGAIFGIYFQGFVATDGNVDISIFTSSLFVIFFVSLFLLGMKLARLYSTAHNEKSRNQEFANNALDSYFGTLDKNTAKKSVQIARGFYRAWVDLLKDAFIRPFSSDYLNVFSKAEKENEKKIFLRALGKFSEVLILSWFPAIISVLPNILANGTRYALPVFLILSLLTLVSLLSAVTIACLYFCAREAGKLDDDFRYVKETVIEESPEIKKTEHLTGWEGLKGCFRTMYGKDGEWDNYPEKTE